MTGVDEVDWARAACVGAPTEWFFPTPRSEGQAVKTLERARSVCQRCPIVVECRDYGKANETHGIWGGVWLEGNNAALHRHFLWFASQGETCTNCHTPIPPGQPLRRYGETTYCKECST